uniref:MIF4G domain-containing protein n=1 Tax=viral metagenome TaxID=1070528 RepID=A0A6C0JIS7_9ZZZZ
MYTLDNFQEIAFSGYDYVLPIQTVTTVRNLSNELGIILTSQPTSTISTERPKLFKLRPGAVNRKPKAENETWEKAPAFKTTKLAQKEGVEKLMNDIRICLNKISSKNYDKQRDMIIQYVKQMDSNREELAKITKSIFDIASSNKFYSELYALLYKELTDEFPHFKEIVGTIITEYIENIHTIRYVDPKVDYDKYCENNKENDKRKAMTAFIVNLAKNTIFNNEIVIEIIIKLQEMVLKYIDEPEKTNEVEEITENIFIFVTMSLKEMSTSSSWSSVIENTKKCSQSKIKEHISMSSRALFKYMDILDFVKKNSLV